MALEVRLADRLVNCFFFFEITRASQKKTDTHGRLMGQNEDEIGDAC